MKLYKIKKSKIDKRGRGLYATRDIKEGTKIIDYIGKIITNEEVDESTLKDYDCAVVADKGTMSKCLGMGEGDKATDDLGITMHFIDNEVDKGTILVIKKTPIFSDDTIEMVARRHYELEINMLSLVSSFIDSRETSNALDKPAKMRMPFNTEKLMLKNFLSWKLSKITR